MRRKRPAVSRAQRFQPFAPVAAQRFIIGYALRKQQSLDPVDMPHAPGDQCLALAARPAMLLLDEPVSGMNASETARAMQLVRTIRASGVTILLVEHDMPMVMQVSDRVVVLNYGRIIAQGSPAAIQHNPDVIRAYLGEGKKRA